MEVFSHGNEWLSHERAARPDSTNYSYLLIGAPCKQAWPVRWLTFLHNTRDWLRMVSGISARSKKMRLLRGVYTTVLKQLISLNRSKITLKLIPVVFCLFHFSSDVQNWVHWKWICHKLVSVRFSSICLGNSIYLPTSAESGLVDAVAVHGHR